MLHSISIKKDKFFSYKVEKGNFTKINIHINLVDQIFWKLEKKRNFTTIARFNFEIKRYIHISETGKTNSGKTKRDQFRKDWVNVSQKNWVDKAH